MMCVETVAGLREAVRRRLDAWDGQIRIDIDVDGIRLQLAADGHRQVYVEYIAVPVARRGSGYGTAVLDALTGWADCSQVTMRLGVSAEYGIPRRVLHRFYLRHGFVGRPELMIRRPADHAEGGWL